MGSYSIIFILGLVVTACLTQKILRICQTRGWTDLPGERKIHQKPVGRLGGVAIWLAFWLIAGIVYIFNPESFFCSAMEAV